MPPFQNPASLNKQTGVLIISWQRSQFTRNMKRWTSDITLLSLSIVHWMCYQHSSWGSIESLLSTVIIIAINIDPSLERLLLTQITSYITDQCEISALSQKIVEKVISEDWGAQIWEAVSWDMPVSVEERPLLRDKALKVENDILRGTDDGKCLFWCSWTSRPRLAHCVMWRIAEKNLSCRLV